MIQIGDRQPQTPVFPDDFPAEPGRDDKPVPDLGGEEDEPVFVSPPPAPWPRVFPGL